MKSIQDSLSPAGDTRETPFSLTQMIPFFLPVLRLERLQCTEEKYGSNQPRMVPPFFLYSSTIWEISRSSSASSSKPLNTSWKIPHHMISAKKKLLLELDHRAPTQSVVLVAMIIKTKILENNNLLFQTTCLLWLWEEPQVPDLPRVDSSPCWWKRTDDQVKLRRDLNIGITSWSSFSVVMATCKECMYVCMSICLPSTNCNFITYYVLFQFFLPAFCTAIKL